MVYYRPTSTLFRNLCIPNIPITKKVISDIESCDLFVVTLITNNYPLNVRLFKLFTNTSQLKHCVPHPVDPSRYLFFLFDIVHILKTIRNNWLNQTDYNRTFIYPSFDNLLIQIQLQWKMLDCYSNQNSLSQSNKHPN